MNQKIKRFNESIFADVIIDLPKKLSIYTSNGNFYYKLRGLEYVANFSPMHEPYHLYEFDLKTFKINGEKLGYKLARFDYYVCDTFLPKSLDFILKPYMRKKNKGMQLCVFLKKD